MPCGIRDRGVTSLRAELQRDVPQAEVEQQQVERLVPERVPGQLDAAGDVDRMPFLAQAAAQPGGDAGVVFHHQDTHVGIVVARLLRPP